MENISQLEILISSGTLSLDVLEALKGELMKQKESYVLERHKHKITQIRTTGIGDSFGSWIRSDKSQIFLTSK